MANETITFLGGPIDGQRKLVHRRPDGELPRMVELLAARELHQYWLAYATITRAPMDPAEPGEGSGESVPLYIHHSVTLAQSLAGISLGYRLT